MICLEQDEIVERIAVSPEDTEREREISRGNCKTKPSDSPLGLSSHFSFLNSLLSSVKLLAASSCIGTPWSSLRRCLLLRSRLLEERNGKECAIHQNHVVRRCKCNIFFPIIVQDFKCLSIQPPISKRLHGRPSPAAQAYRTSIRNET